MFSHGSVQPTTASKRVPSHPSIPSKNSLFGYSASSTTCACSASLAVRVAPHPVAKRIMPVGALMMRASKIVSPGPARLLVSLSVSAMAGVLTTKPMAIDRQGLTRHPRWLWLLLALGGVFSDRTTLGALSCSSFGHRSPASPHTARRRAAALWVHWRRSALSWARGTIGGVPLARHHNGR